MAERVSALAGHNQVGRFGTEGEPGVILCDVGGLQLHQIAAWPETISDVGRKAAEAAQVEAAPGPGRAAQAEGGALLRTEPLKWWLIGATPPLLAPEEGASLDLSHSRTQVRLSGPQATALLNRYLPLDLSDAAFPVGAVGSSALHHAGVTLWRSAAGYELFLPRGFALSLWEVLLEGAAQFGAEVTRFTGPAAGLT